MNLEELKKEAIENGVHDHAEEWQFIENVITDYINPYPASCYRKLSTEKLCKLLLNIIKNN